MKSKSKNNIVIQIVIFVVVFAVAFLGTRYVLGGEDKIEAEIAKGIAIGNKNLPMLINIEMRADSIVSLGNNTVRYSFTLLNIDEQTPKVYVNSLKLKLKSDCQDYLDTNKEMEPFRVNDFSLNYYYKDKNGKLLFDFIIQPKKKEAPVN